MLASFVLPHKGDIQYDIGESIYSYHTLRKQPCGCVQWGLPGSIMMIPTGGNFCLKLFKLFMVDRRRSQAHTHKVRSEQEVTRTICIFWTFTKTFNNSCTLGSLLHVSSVPAVLDCKQIGTLPSLVFLYITCFDNPGNICLPFSPTLITVTEHA